MSLTYLSRLLLTATLTLANPIHLSLGPREVSETYEIWSNGHLTTATAPCSSDLAPLTTITDIHTLGWYSGCQDCYPPYSETWTIATSAVPAFKLEETPLVTVLTPGDTFSIPPHPLGTLTEPPLTTGAGILEVMTIPVAEASSSSRGLPLTATAAAMPEKRETA